MFRRPEEIGQAFLTRRQDKQQIILFYTLLHRQERVWRDNVEAAVLLQTSARCAWSCQGPDQVSRVQLLKVSPQEHVADLLNNVCFLLFEVHWQLLLLGLRGQVGRTRGGLRGQVRMFSWETWGTNIDQPSKTLKGNTGGAGKNSWRRLLSTCWCTRYPKGVPEAGRGAGGEGEEEEGGGGEGGRRGRIGQKSRRSCFGSEHWRGDHH